MTILNNDTVNDILKIAFSEQESKKVDPESPASHTIVSNLGRGQLEAKTDLILSGSEVFTSAIKFYNSDIEIRWHYKDGDFVLKGQKIATLLGYIPDIVRAEVISLNFLSHLSSVATYTHNLANCAPEFSYKILKSTKFLIGLQNSEYKAFLHGGGFANSLTSQKPTIPQSRIASLGGMSLALAQLSDNIKHECIFKVSEYNEALLAIESGVTYLQLDNLSIHDTFRLLKIKTPAISFEIFGDIDPNQIMELAKMGAELFRPRKNHNFEAELAIRWDWNQP